MDGLPACILRTRATPPTECGTAARLVRQWTATGVPELDLSNWITDLVHGRASAGDARFPAMRAAISSHVIPTDDLSGEQLTDAARTAFLTTIGGLPGGPCRVWSFLPRPTDPDTDTLDRYMRFNAGRTAAYVEMRDRVRSIPAGTCVGHAGRELVVHALWTSEPFEPIENPRQQPAFRYSSRFGPVPPAFTRAARLPAILLASGTASVVGENSAHHGNLPLQFEETTRNLDALAAAGGGDGVWRDVCVYVRDEGDLDAAHKMCQSHFGDRVRRVLHAPLCRGELLLEIEGYCHVV